MKAHVIRVLLGIMYIGLVVSLLLIQTQMISGQMQRTIAWIETILLVIPTIVVMVLYVRIKEKVESQTEQENVNKTENIVDFHCLDEFEEQLSSMMLSKREMEVAWFLYRGYTNRQIAEELFVAESTVKKHVTHIYEKVQVSGRKEFKEKVKSVNFM